MKIAVIGTRGVPARYGGFETCAEELGKRLAGLGHDITAYNRARYYPDRPRVHEGIRLAYPPSLPGRALETLSHTFFSILHALFGRYDVFLVFNSATSPLLLLPALFRKKVALNVDGLEWEREKWNAAAKGWHRFGAWLAARLPATLITDSRTIQAYYRKTFGRETAYIAYGAPVVTGRNPALLERFGLRPGEYFLQVTRFEPENNPHLTVRAFETVRTDKKLVLVGGSSYPTPYGAEVRRTRDPRVCFTGFIYNREILDELLANAFAYVHGNEVGGTNPALLQAMGAGRLVIARDVPYNREVLREAGIYFDKSADDLRNRMAWALEHAEELAARGERARAIVRNEYDWDRIAADYERLFLAGPSFLRENG